jgi:hypothetical protein
VAVGRTTAPVSAGPETVKLIRVVECIRTDLKPREWHVPGAQAARDLARTLVEHSKSQFQPTMIEKFVERELEEISVVPEGPDAVNERVSRVKDRIRGESFVDPKDWKTSNPAVIIVKDRATAEAEQVPPGPG